MSAGIFPFLQFPRTPSNYLNRFGAGWCGVRPRSFPCSSCPHATLRLRRACGLPAFGSVRVGLGRTSERGFPSVRLPHLRAPHRDISPGPPLIIRTVDQSKELATDEINLINNLALGWRHSARNPHKNQLVESSLLHRPVASGRIPRSWSPAKKMREF